MSGVSQLSLHRPLRADLRFAILEAKGKGKGPAPEEDTMTTQIMTRNGWTDVKNARTVAFDFQGGTTTIEGEFDGKVKQITVARTMIRHTR